ncbi:MAG: hypothetical protein QM504_15485 [Pseudomonadota bacterium]
MNNNYDEFLKQVFQIIPTAKDDYDFSFIIKIFKKASEQDIIANENFIYSSFNIVSERLAFLNRYKYSEQSEFSSHHIQIIADIIKTVVTILEQNTSNLQNSLYELIVSFIIIRQIEYGSNFNIWKKISSNLSVNKNWINGCFAIVKSFDTSLSVLENTPINEKESLNLYKEGIKEKDFGKIYFLIERLEISGKPLCDSFIISESAKFLSWFDIEGLVQIINGKNDTLNIICLLQNLTNDKKLEVCLKTDNVLAQFECIKQVVSIRDKSDLSPKLTQLLSDCIIKLSQQDNLWKQFLLYFNTYPLRYPALQTSLGKALAQISDKKIVQYVSIINLDKSEQSSQFINKCVNSFSREADEKRSVFLPCKIYERWDSFIDSSIKNDEFRAFDVFYTNFADVVITYLVYKFKKNQLLEKIEQIITQIININTKWFYSKTQKISFFYILLSQLLIFSYAWKKTNYNLTKKDELYIEIDALLKNTYLFNTCRLQDKTVLEKIRSNFYEHS